MSLTSAGGGVTSRTGGEHISRLVETPIGRFRLWRNLNNCVIIYHGKVVKSKCREP